MTDHARPHKPHRTPAETLRMARSHTGRTALVLAILAVIALGFAPFGVHEEMFSLDYALSTVVMRWAAGLAIVAIVLAVLAALMVLAVSPRRGLIVPLVAVALAAAVMAVVGQVRARSLADPPVHDVATDWRDPLMLGPSALAARGADANPVQADPRVGIQSLRPRMEGARVAEINARTCAAAVPAVITGSVEEAYDKTRAAMLREGLSLVTENPAGGRLEASWVTKWLKLKGDVVARIRAEGAGARIDFRSISRTGEVDLGENCRLVTRLRNAVAK